MSGIVVLMVKENSGFAYPGIVIYLCALYTFYTTAHSAVAFCQFRRLNSPVLLAAKALNLISAAMSVLGLQTAMIARFGEKSGIFRQQMNALTGSGVCILVLGTAVYMIIRAHTTTRKAEGT